jgi:hypothetical protein
MQLAADRDIVAAQTLFGPRFSTLRSTQGLSRWSVGTGDGRADGSTIPRAG